MVRRIRFAEQTASECRPYRADIRFVPLSFEFEGDSRRCRSRTCGGRIGEAPMRVKAGINHLRRKSFGDAGNAGNLTLVRISRGVENSKAACDARAAFCGRAGRNGSSILRRTLVAMRDRTRREDSANWGRMPPVSRVLNGRASFAMPHRKVAVCNSLSVPRRSITRCCYRSRVRPVSEPIAWHPRPSREGSRISRASGGRVAVDRPVPTPVRSNPASAAS